MIEKLGECESYIYTIVRKINEIIEHLNELEKPFKLTPNMGYAVNLSGGREMSDNIGQDTE